MADEQEQPAAEGVAAQQDTTGTDPANAGNGPAEETAQADSLTAAEEDRVSAAIAASQAQQSDEITALKQRTNEQASQLAAAEQVNQKLHDDLASSNEQITAFANRAADAETERDSLRASLDEANTHIAAMSQPQTAPVPEVPASTGTVFESVEAEVAYLKNEIEQIIVNLKARIQRLTDLLHHPSTIPLFARVEESIKHVVEIVREKV